MLKIQTLQLFREWRTPDGGRPLARIPLELSWFTLEELGVLTTSLKEEQLRKFVYLTILITFLGHLQQISHGKAWFRVLSMNFFLIVQFQAYLSRMPHVLSVMFLPDLELSWFQLKLCVHHPGPESTMATSQLKQIHLIDRHTPVLTLIQMWLQELVLTLILHSSTMLLLVAMVSHVLHIKTTTYSLVLYAQSDHMLL